MQEKSTLLTTEFLAGAIAAIVTGWKAFESASELVQVAAVLGLCYVVGQYCRSRGDAKSAGGAA